MKSYSSILLVGFAWVVFGLQSVFAQEAVTHTVQEGETLYGIAKQYRVTPYSILQLNPEIKNSSEVQPNTVLIIKKGADEALSVIVRDTSETTDPEPLRFERHRVKKRETLFGLTQLYGISEEQLKKYNTELYAEPLRKGMVLRIPVYPEVVADEERDIDFETYVVLPKETRWSIAHKYGISMDSLLLLNPELPKNSSILSVGQELRLPRPKGDSLEGQEVALFESFTVPKSMGIFRVGQLYGIPTDSVIKLNPEIVDLGGLKEGMVLRLPKRVPENQRVNTDNFVFYEVKPKQNLFRLTRNLKISRDSLFALNPELENGLKAGMVLKLPKAKGEQLEVKNSLVLDQINLADSINTVNRPEVLFLLPFRLDRIDLGNVERTKKQVESRRDIKYALGLYSGALVALDSMKRMGVSINARIIDSERKLERVKAALTAQPLYEIDAIVGPVDPNLLGEVAVQAATYEIPVIAPFAAESGLSHSNVFYTEPSDAILRQRMLDHIAKIRTTENLIVIADENHQVAKDSILSKFPMARVAKMSEDGSLHLEDFLVMLSEQEINWVFVETDKPNLAASISSILNAANAETETGEVVVKMFTTNYNTAFQGSSISRPHLSRLEFMFPSSYREVGSDAFVRAYSAKFGHAPDRYAVRGFDLTFDMLLKLAYKKNLFEVSKMVGQTEYSGNRFDFQDDWSSGFYNHATFLMQYDDLRIKQLDTNDIESNLYR